MATEPLDPPLATPTATVTPIGEGFLREFDRRLHELAKAASDPDLRDDLDAQAEAAVVIWRLFHRGHAVPPQRRSWVLQSFAPLFTRCREHSRPVDLLAAILDLDREEEVRRAVWTRESQFEGYQYLPGEDIYPTTGWLGDYLQYARQNSVPLAFHFWAGVTVFGAAAKRMIYADCGSFEVRMPWYTILAGLPAVGKGAAMHPAVDILLRLNRMIGDSPDTRGQVVNMIPEDVTPESFIEELADITGWRHTTEETAEGTKLRTEVFPVDATAFLALDELATFFGSDTWAARKRVPFMVTIKEKDEYTKGTRKDGRVHLKNLGISMLGCCAPGWVREALTRDVTEGGLLDRMVFVYRDPAWLRKYQYSLLNIPPLDPLRANMLARELLPIAQLPHRLVCRFTHDAREFVHDAHQQQVRAEQQRFEAEDPGETMSSNRMGTTLLRLAMVLSISEHGIVNGISINRGHCEAAQRILDAEASSLQTFLEVAHRTPESSTSGRIAQWVAKHRGGCASLSEITQKFKKLIGTSRVIREHLATCIDEGSLVRASVANRTIYRTPEHRACSKCSA